MPNIVVAAIRGSLGKPFVARRSSKSIRFRTAGLASIAVVALSTMATTTTTASALTEATAVPLRMHLSETMKNSADWLAKASLIPIDFSPKIGPLVTEKTESTLVGSKAVAENTGLAGSICFVVRRPGDPKTLSNFGMFGVVKETGVDDEGLRDFYEDHFSYPLYRDENLDFYRAFGDGKITDHLSWWDLLNPYKIYKGMKEIGNRMKGKNLVGNYKGEGLKTGGIIVFGSDGEPKYAYPETTGTALNTDDIMAALRAVGGSTGDGKEEL